MINVKSRARARSRADATATRSRIRAKPRASALCNPLTATSETSSRLPGEHNRLDCNHRRTTQQETATAKIFKMRRHHHTHTDNLPPHLTHLVSLPGSETHCRIRALSSLSALLSTPEWEEDVDQEASLRGGRSLSEPMEAFRWCLLRPRRLLDLDDGVAGFTRWASYAFWPTEHGSRRPLLTWSRRVE